LTDLESAKLVYIEAPYLYPFAYAFALSSYEPLSLILIRACISSQETPTSYHPTNGAESANGAETHDVGTHATPVAEGYLSSLSTLQKETKTGIYI